MIVVGGDEIMAGRGWWRQDYGWSSVVARFSNTHYRTFSHTILLPRLGEFIQPVITCSKSTMEISEQCVKSVQS